MTHYRIGLAIAALVVGLAMEPAGALANAPGNQVVGDAQALAIKGDVKTALIKLKNAVAEDPSNGDARFALGSLELSIGDPVSAQVDLDLARKNGIPDTKVAPLLSAAYLAQGKFTDALAIAPCAADAACQSTVLAVHARARLGLKDITGADKDSADALAAAPDNISAQVARAIVLLSKGDSAKAEEAVNGVLAVDPKAREALTLKGILRRQAGDFPGALTNFRAALAIDPRDIFTREHLAMALMATNDDAGARAEIDHVLDQAPSSPLALDIKGILLARANKMAEALETVRPATTAIASLPNGPFVLAVIFSGNNDLEQALDYATRFHIAVPDSVTGAKLLANIEFRQQAYDKVIATLEPMRGKLADDADALNLLGSAYLADGHLAEADAALADAVKAQPKDQMTRARLALARLQTGGTREEGVKELEGLVDANPNNARFDVALISTHIANGDYDKAIAAANEMAKHQPKSPMPATLRGSAELAKGDEDAASRDFTAALAIAPDFVPAALYLAETAVRNGDYAKARAGLDSILQRTPDDPRVLLARARVELRAGQTAAALPFLQRAVTAHPDDVELRVQRVQVLAALGKHDDAAQAATDLARDQPHNFRAVDFAAQILMKLGKQDDALALYRQLVNDQPAMPETRRRLAEALAAAGHPEEARQAYDQAISANPHDITAWAGRIALELQTNGFQPATALAEKAASQNPDNTSVALIPGELLAATKHLPEAEAAYRKVLAARPSTEAISRLYTLIAGEGRQAEADKLMADWLKSKPEDNTARMVWADGELSRKDYREAIKQYELLIVKMPRNPAVANNLAWAYDRTDDPRAMAMGLRAYNLAPSDPAIADTYAYILFRNGKIDRAAGLERMAHSASPGNPQIAYHLAKVLVGRNDTTDALSVLKPAIEANLSFDESNDAKALYAQLGGK